ncbi:hypothetical protein LTR10_012496 [Elasticomyces elasticus]|nr:hypothetical protein LTR10_012496 [Elasticomyces elasticus]KAK4965970.1 hypothetical protein LTR42_011984 [Elasticomyces elasticus]
MAKRLHKEHDDNYPNGYQKRAKKRNYPTDAHEKHSREDSDKSYAWPPIIMSTRTRRQAAADLPPKYINGPTATVCGLFRLPTELRNAIYEYVLPQGKKIIFSKDKPLKVPALLQVCSKIRNETRDMFYVGNKLVIVTKKCAPGLCISWKRHCRALGLRDDKIGIVIMGKPDWTNLMAWCKAMIEDDAISPMFVNVNTTSLHEQQAAAVMSAAFNIAERTRDKGETWADCMPALADLRAVVCGYNPIWR